ncbi:unnamed protein product [Vitrella brassicaformis CCMP3155]|uniref:Uncharacterized protein n=1 Tax=Vitrella brassicaformis (strain CCMP3155) TaxID=1169540 RepID=A0A0G4FB56_VITBC|nr:unnamed protein product [Vitrella brassicaformis CCMP3155]|eukprot:CEM09874.1 unnamed protein product [Vitrella brassicaformis CCMP3155]
MCPTYLTPQPFPAPRLPAEPPPPPPSWPSLHQPPTHRCEKISVSMELDGPDEDEYPLSALLAHKKVNKRHRTAGVGDDEEWEGGADEASSEEEEEEEEEKASGRRGRAKKSRKTANKAAGRSVGGRKAGRRKAGGREAGGRKRRELDRATRVSLSVRPLPRKKAIQTVVLRRERRAINAVMPPRTESDMMPHKHPAPSVPLEPMTSTRPNNMTIIPSGVYKSRQPGVTFDSTNNQWKVQAPGDENRYIKEFCVLKMGMKEAQEAAEALAKQVWGDRTERGGGWAPPKSGITGVHWHKQGKFWYAQWQQNKQQKQSSPFHPCDYGGSDGAKQACAALRAEMVQLHYHMGT